LEHTGEIPQHKNKPGKDDDLLIWEQGKGYREPTKAERAEADREHRELLERLEKLHEEVARALIAGGPFSDAKIRRAIAILRLDPPREWEEDGYEQMDFNEWVADALERAYFPTPAQTKARTRAKKQAQRRGYRGLIDIVAKREGISRAKALVKVQEEFKELKPTPEALAKFLQRDETKKKKAPREPRASSAKK